MRFLKTLAAAALIAAWSTLAFAQTSPGLTQGQKLTPAQWNALFASKQDSLGYTPINVAGGTFTGRIVTAPPGASTSGFNLTPGTAPAAPVNGDIWFTSSGFFARAAGVTVGPFQSVTSSNFAATLPLVVSFPSNIVTYALQASGANTVLGSIAGGIPGDLSKTQLTTLINPATGSLSGAVPAWPNNSTTFFRGDGTYAAVAQSALSGLGTGVSAAIGTAIGNAGAPVLFNGALGSPSSIGTLPALTLGGTVAGGGNAINNVVIGASSPGAGTFAALKGTSLSLTNLLASSTAPTIASGCGAGSPSISAPNGTIGFRVTIGTASGSTCVINLPTATTGWNCYVTDQTTITTANYLVRQSSSTASQVTFTGYSTAAAAATWVASDVLAISCFAF